jgi:molybdenum cofactor cytidylyltransferase
VAAALLAAGFGSRFDGDGPKPLALLDGRPLVSWALDAMTSSGVDPCLLVVGAAADQIAAVAPSAVQVVVAPAWADGIAHSLHAVLDALEGEQSVTAVCIGLADQPRVGSDAYRRLTRAHAEGAELAVATYSGTRGNPVLLGRTVWPAARELRGDTGARALMTDRDVVEVDCTGTGDPRDVDTLADLRALIDDVSDETE